MKKKKNELAVLVKAVDNVPVCSTLDMCQPLGVEHHAIVQLVKKYELQLKEIGPVAFQMRVGTRGGTPISFCYLDEEQATFLVTLMKNSAAVVTFKQRLSREFYRMKKEITRIQAVARNNSLNIEWVEAREAGKPVRRVETDMMKKFVEYSFERGSVHADKYYGNITRMSNKTVFDIQQRVRNTRDVCNTSQLVTLQMVDTVVTRALEADMAVDVPYKQIYQNVKAKVQQFADLFGKSEIPETTLQIGGI